MKSYLKELNEVQRLAVTTTEGPVLVVAGPGSGKTRVLTYRIAHLIEEGVFPHEILALTFTNKAAKEMKKRIAGVVGDRAKKVWAGTFHSIFARILRVEAEKIGYPSNFTIYDTTDSKSVIAAVIKEIGLPKEAYNVNSILSRISSAKSKIISPVAYVDDVNLRKQDRMNGYPHFHEIYRKYVERCKRAGAMDFDDLLYQLFILLYKNKDNIREKYQQRYKYIMVDEFQDTNQLQYAILRKLILYDGSPRNICVVGDDAQSIYAFRGATIENILDFEKDFKDLKVFKLEQNYRSTEHIVQAANEIIQNNNKQIPKKIWSDKGSGQKIKVFSTISDTEEGKRVADFILEQKNRSHLRNSDIAILYRTNYQSRIFEEYLRRYNIPYRVFGGLSFYQRKEVKDVIAYLRLAINPQDEEAFRRVINYPKRGIGKATIDKLSELAGQTNSTMWDGIGILQVGARAKKSLENFRKMITQFNQKATTVDAFELAFYIVRNSGIIDTLKNDKTTEGVGRLDNITALLDGIKDFVENDELTDDTAIADKSLASYIQNIALLTDLDEEKKDEEYVSLMSVHAAKGLEFKSVFVVGMEEDLFPSLLSKGSMDEIAEERRLFYVAITRAEQFLTLTYSKSRYKFGKMNAYIKPSRFLLEIPDIHLQSNMSNYSSAKGRTGSKVLGNFKTRRPQTPVLRVDPKTFKPSPGTAIQVGMKVLHMKFGEGKVLSIDGLADNRIATIFFKEVDSPERKIMLKFAKLQILN